ncbi:unnamed protein product [Ostreobium quekettii]|uniref:Cyclin-dependent kinases regulatory subunit n=1 Tax=Ostreobium quekettii TaxID=121088 RepID=A0A8S1IM33_9CHLO|nr:unnamed protein product [Ostreobium quekettii]
MEWGPGVWHVVVPKKVAKSLPKGRLLIEKEWRALGIQQSRGWMHYAIHRPEPHIMLFKRPKDFQKMDPAAQQKFLAEADMLVKKKNAEMA